MNADRLARKLQEGCKQAWKEGKTEFHYSGPEGEFHITLKEMEIPPGLSKLREMVERKKAALTSLILECKEKIDQDSQQDEEPAQDSPPSNTTDSSEKK